MSFSNEDRLKLSYKYALTANMFLDQGIHVVISVMALFHECINGIEKLYKLLKFLNDIFLNWERDPKVCI